MISRSFLMIISLITFLKLITANSYSSWEPAISSLGSETNDQTKKRLKSRMLERISQFGNDGGDSMRHSSLYPYENVEHINVGKNEYENKHVDPSFRSRGHEYEYKEEPLRHNTGGHHLNKNHNFKKSFHGNFASEMDIPMRIHSDRLRRKLDEKGNMTQDSNLTLHNEAEVASNEKPNEEYRNGTKKPCIKTHPYTIISSPTSNVTHNNSESTTLKTTGLMNKTNDQKVATNQSMHNENGTHLSMNETNENLTTSMPKNKILSKNDSLTDIDSTLKSHDAGISLKPKGQGFGLPCNVIGQWVSEAGGVTLNIKTNPDISHLVVEVHELSPDKKGFLSSSWKINGNLPFADTRNKINSTAAPQITELGGPIVLMATTMHDPSDNTERKVAVFLGECKVCYEGMESVVGTWSLKRFSKNCMDASLSENVIRDVLHREAISTTAKENSKSESRDGTKANDSTDKTSNKHLYRRHNYITQGKRRRSIRNNPRYI